MTNEETRRMLEQRTRLEERLRALGGTIPRPWPWDDDTMARNLQLIEAIEDRQAEILRLAERIKGGEL